MSGKDFSVSHAPASHYHSHAAMSSMRDSVEMYPEAQAMPLPEDFGCLDNVKMHFALVQQTFAQFAQRYPTEALVTIVALTVLGVGILVGKAIIAIAALAVAGLLAYTSCCQDADGVANGVKVFDARIMKQQHFDGPQWIRTNETAKREAAAQAARESDGGERVERSGTRSATTTPRNNDSSRSRQGSTVHLQMSSPASTRDAELDS